MTDIVVGDEKILFSTALGDVVEVIVSEKKDVVIQKNVVNKIKVKLSLDSHFQIFPTLSRKGLTALSNPAENYRRSALWIRYTHR